MPYRPAVALALSLLAGCAHLRHEPAAVASYLVVRHAEKGDDDPRDPNLSPAGHARAQRLAVALREDPVRAVYATAYRRTQQTAAPVARAHGLPVVVYDAAQPAAGLAARLRREHPRGTTVIVAHSNTAPDIAAALCACAVEPMADSEYDRRIRIDVDAAGRAAYTVSRDR